MSAATAPTAVSADSSWALTWRWEQIAAIAPRLAATIESYLAVLGATRTPRTVESTRATLCQFAGYVVALDPGCTSVASITGEHVGYWCAWLALQVDLATGRQVSARTVNDRFAEVRRFFERLDAQNHPDAPLELPVPSRHRRRRPATKPQVQRPRGRRVDFVTDSCLQPWRRRHGGVTWEEIARRAPQIVETMTAYLRQLAVSSRPGTIDATSLALRQFAAHITSTDPACTSVAAIERRHIESYKIALTARSVRDGACRPRRSACGSGCCAPSSSGSSTGTTPTPRDGSRCSSATSLDATIRYRSSSTTPPPPSSWPPWPSNRTGSAG
jgi:hypothetical protein